MIRGRAVGIAVALTLAAWFAAGAAAARPTPGDTALTIIKNRVSDEAIAHDLGLIDSWRARLDGLPAAAQDPWRAAAARTWLEAARVEYTDGDETRFPEVAFTRAAALISQIEAGAPPIVRGIVPNDSLPEGTSRVGGDLWFRLEKLKEHPGFACAAADIAMLEVQLAWASNEAVDQGGCKTDPHMAEATRLAREARLQAEACGAQPAAEKRERPAPAAPAPTAPVEAPAPQLPTAEELEIPRNVHFGLNRADISTVSHDVIAGVAGVLRKYPSISVRLEGHTDSRASAAYNLELSKRRVMAVYGVFLDMGIDSVRLTTAYKGKAELTATEDSNRGFALNRRVEMIFVDSEGREIKAQSQEQDLQLEREPHTPPRPATKPRPKPAVPVPPKP
jgi:outer membrane protein OmpA-like peptidoglycan-associated protein